MLFLASLAVVAWLCILPSLLRFLQPESMSPAETALRILSLVACLTTTAPVAMEFAQLMRQADGQPLPLGQTSTLPLSLLGVGSALLVIAFSGRLWLQRLSPDARFLSVGANTIGLVIGLYLAFVVADQVTFLRGAGDDVGILSWALVEPEFAETVKDVRCDSPLMLVRGTETDVATYRCPHLPQFTLARFSATPIFAWPAYSEGHSPALARAIRDMRARASAPAQQP